jgi:hypothetical protein
MGAVGGNTGDDVNALLLDVPAQVGALERVTVVGEGSGPRGGRRVHDEPMDEAGLPADLVEDFPHPRGSTLVMTEIGVSHESSKSYEGNGDWGM